MTRPNLDVHDHIAELTRVHRHAERYTIDRGPTKITLNHVVRVPPLLTQLGWIAPTGRGDDRSGGGYESRPAAALDALGTLVRIDTDAARWLRVLEISDWGDTRDLISRLGAQVPQLDRCDRKHLVRDRATDQPCCTYHHLAADVGRWWTQCRVITGWDSAAWRPNSTCPMCEHRGTVRVKESDRIGFCTNCHETWTPDTIGLLAEHIRLESAARRTTAVEQLVCWCPVERPALDRWGALCPACASPYCHRALAGGGKIAG